MLTPCPVLFSGHNERAIVSLCRFFRRQGIAFAIVASGQDDAILQTDWREQVLWVREGPALNQTLMQALASALRKRGLRPVFCATSEFLNQFALSCRQAMVDAGWLCTLPAAEVYLRLSSKASSPACIEALTGLRMPREQVLGHWKAPCVIKPKKNVVDGKVLYPLLCPDEITFAKAASNIDPSQWFSQDWIEGQSIYLCAYLDRAGGHDSYWQLNLLQQPGGKSMVLACTGDNPGIDVPALMAGLHRMGFWGPFMMEIIRDLRGSLHFIEVNPRFWGPLNLSLEACPALLHRFARDCGLDTRGAAAPTNGPGPHWYAWAHGAKSKPWRAYPALPDWLDETRLMSWLLEHDIYAQSDTAALSNRH